MLVFRHVTYLLSLWALVAPALALGTISVTSDLPAYVEIRGEKVGETPLSMKDLDRGTYEVTITALGSGETKVFRVSIPAGDDVVRLVDARFEGGEVRPAPRARPIVAKPAVEKPRVERTVVLPKREKKASKPKKKKKTRSPKPAPEASQAETAASEDQPAAGLAVNAGPVKKLLSIREARRSRRAPAPAAAPPPAPPSPVAPAPAPRHERETQELDRLKARWRDPYVRRHVIAGGAALIGAATSSGILAGIGLGGVIMNEVVHREDEERRRL